MATAETDDIVRVNRATGEIIEDDTQASKDTKANTQAKPTAARGNSEFVMLYRRFIQQIADLGVSDPQALRVLLFLCRHMDFRNALAVPMDLMADMLKLSRQTVSAKVKILSKEGWIAVYRLGRQNVYVVNPDVVWTSYAAEKEYAVFDAKVMLSREDNWNLPKTDKKGIRHLDRNVLRAMAQEEFPEPADE